MENFRACADARTRKKQISKAFGQTEKPLVVICTLKGATPFFADLVRSLELDTVWEFMSFSSYGMGTTVRVHAVLAVHRACRWTSAFMHGCVHCVRKRAHPHTHKHVSLLTGAFHLQSSGAVQLVLDLKMDITGRDVLIVEDILVWDFLDVSFV